MSMTRKQALAFLRHGIDAAFDYELHTNRTRHEERWRLYEEMLAACKVLVPLVNGKVPPDCLAYVCDRCRMRYVPKEVLYGEDNSFTEWLCHVCREIEAQQGQVQEVTA